MIYRSSQINTAKRCIAKAYFQYNLGLRKKGSGKKNPDLFFGTAVHKAIEIFVLENHEKAIIYLDSLDFPSNSAKTKAIAKVLLNLFTQKFKDKLLYSERYFALPLSDKIKLLGRFDLVAENLSGIYIGELKTTIPYYLLYKPNDQFISYYIAGKQEFKNVDKVVLYNLDPNSVDLIVSFIYYTKKEVEDWKKEMIAFINYYQSCVDTNTIVRSPGACLDFHRRCEFHELCTADDNVRKLLIESSFETNEEVLNLRW